MRPLRRHWCFFCFFCCWEGLRGCLEGNRMPIRITVKGLTVRRAGRTLLDRVSLEAAPGRATVLMGPSGCGKSTLLRMLNRLDAEEHLFETEGSIHMDGEEILRPMGVWELAALRRRVGMVFQAPSPFPMSIGENIAYGIRLQERLTRRDLDVRIEEALTRAALFDEVKDRLTSDARRLSGGQQQRLCIARALAVRPEALLLDEPTSALDPLSTLRIEELLTALKGSVTMLLVTHQPAQAQRIGDRLFRMEAGRIL